MIPARSQLTSARRMPAEAGVWLFILADMMVFATFFATTLYYRNQDPSAFGAAQAQLNQGLGLANTILMLTGSLFVAIGVIATRDRTAGIPHRWFAAAIACGAAFTVIKVVEYTDLVDHGHTAHASKFFMCFFLFTGVHLMHVVSGCALLAWTAARTRRKQDRPADTTVIEGTASYWHMVDLLWLVLFTTLYLVR